MSQSESTDADLWDDAGFVVSSTYRREVLDRLCKRPGTPTTVAEDIEHAVTHVSRALRTLRGRGVVELLVPEERKKGRIYGATDHGEAVAERVGTLAERGESADA